MGPSEKAAKAAEKAAAAKAALEADPRLENLMEKLAAEGVTGITRTGANAVLAEQGGHIGKALNRLKAELGVGWKKVKSMVPGAPGGGGDEDGEYGEDGALTLKSLMPDKDALRDARAAADRATIALLEKERDERQGSPQLALLIRSGLTTLNRMSKKERGLSALINDVGELLREAGQLDEAAKLFSEALELRRKLKGDKDAATLTSLNNLGLLLREQGRYAEATPLLAEAVESRRAAQGSKHPETLTAINNYGALLKASGKHVDAAPLYAEALATRRDVLGNSHPDTLTSINNMASLLQAQGKLGAAEPLLYEAATTAKDTLGADHPHTKIFELNLAKLQQKLKETIEQMRQRRLSKQ